MGTRDAELKFMIGMKETNKLLNNVLRALPAISAIPFFAPKKTSILPYVLGALGVAVAGGIAAVMVLSPRTRYRALDARRQALNGGEPYTYAPPHDRPPQVTAVVAVEVRGFQLSTQMQFGAGLPFTRSSGFDTVVLLDSLNDVRTEPGTSRVLYGSPYDARLPTYHRLDVSLERVFDLTRRTALTLQAGVTNAYDRRNLFYLDLFTLRRIDQLPLIPSAGLKLAFR